MNKADSSALQGWAPTHVRSAGEGPTPMRGDPGAEGKGQSQAGGPRTAEDWTHLFKR